jgi:uncharacterized protein (TIGR03083 family)
MDRAAHVDHLRADSAALVAAQRAEPSAPVWDGLGGWDRTRLLRHVAGVHAWMRAQLSLGAGTPLDFSTVAQPPAAEGLAPWFEAGVEELSHQIGSMDLDARWPTWAGPQPGTFFPRRAAQETAVHRWDAAGGAVDPALAADGIDELLELFAPLLDTGSLSGAEATIHLHATDRDGEWLIRLSTDGITFEHGHAKGDVALRGTASDLLLWTWNRVPVDERFEVFGDPQPLQTWRTTVRF